ncbi:hypothetical protein GR183_05550 [Stappia sp. GBMRC 2046]|uniref:DUF4185 domain-containing protein n=1 Tax=Stappia sediminis TaxID=2692190 RepID=A0A7X3LSN4_9HYPH|nr:hypothetical protein [Stappia sediminis]MXN64361.1 hypothetical protein [Stappia sediminis]
MRFAMAGICALYLLVWPECSHSTNLEPAVRIEVAGGVETVFDWSKEACENSHVPDTPARAFRKSDGTVALIASHNDNRFFTGPSLEALQPDCSIVFEASRSAELAEFDDLSWMSGLYTPDGETIYVLAHTELRGHRSPGLCPAGRYGPCLLNTVTGLVSRDGGKTFKPQGGGPAVVATLPYPYPTDRPRRVGYANPTNIIELDGWHYAAMFADRYRAQKRGVCIIRTRTLEDPASWRAWDGSGFNARFVNPFEGLVEDPEAHVCEPVSSKYLVRMIGGLSLHEETGTVVAVFGDRRKGKDGERISGFYVSTSRDMINWSEPRLIMRYALLWEDDCSKPKSYFYPSLLDPDSETRNFDHADGAAYLYFVRYNLESCKVTWDRDLVRVPVRVVTAR